ncbi:hypothetical protein Tco_0824379 [Tanacetum coccineum]|uniref:Transposase (putative) gypsy type domain-containing protein n=1 Tax=Tanacetum coccineum TaxID=301880 RepID=A0ABQ5AKS0_9ASTR
MNVIGVYHRIFDFSGVRIPFSSFLLALIKHYKVHFTQLGPLGLNKVITFEVLCRSLQIEPTVTLFRVFQTLCKQGDWFSFAKRHAQSSVCIDNNPIVDPKHVAGSYRMADVRRLSTHVMKLGDMPEGVLVLSGLSRVWKSRTYDPLLRGTYGNGMELWTNPVEAPILLYSPATVDAVVPDPTPGDIATNNPSAKVIAKAEASQKQKASTSGATLGHVNKRTSDDDDDACYEILIVTAIRSAVVIPPSGNQSGGSTAPADEDPNNRDSQGKGIMTNTDAADAPSLVLVVRGSPLVLHLLSESFLEMPFIEILLGFRHSGKTNVITAEKICVLTRGFWCTIPTTWGKRCKKQFLMIKEVHNGMVIPLDSQGKLIQKLLLNQKCMGYLVRAYYSISPTRYYKDDSCWSVDLKSKATEDIISIGSFLEALVLNHYFNIPPYVGTKVVNLAYLYFFPFSSGPYYATYPEGGITENYEFTREEWDAPHQPTLTVLTKEVFND